MIQFYFSICRFVFNIGNVDVRQYLAFSVNVACNISNHVVRFQFRGLAIGLGSLLQASLVVTAVIIGVYNTDVLESGEIQQG